MNKIGAKSLWLLCVVCGFVALTPERYRGVSGRWKLHLADPAHGLWNPREMTESAQRDIRRVLRRAKIKLDAPFTLTCFRKSFAQNHADAGAHPKTLAKLMGHSDPQMTMRFHNRVSDANIRAAATTMDRLFTREFH